MGRGPWRYDLSARLSARATDDCVITGTRCLSQPTWPRGAAVEGDHTSPRLKVGGHFGAKPKGSSLNDRGAGDPKRRFNYASERPRSGTWRPTQAHRELQAKQNKTKQNPQDFGWRWPGSVWRGRSAHIGGRDGLSLAPPTTPGGGRVFNITLRPRPGGTVCDREKSARVQPSIPLATGRGHLFVEKIFFCGFLRALPHCLTSRAPLHICACGRERSPGT